MKKGLKKIKKTYTLLPKTVEIIERLAAEEQRNENSVVDIAIQKLVATKKVY